MAIGLSHGGSTLYSSPSPSREVLVGTREGVVTIERDGLRVGMAGKTPRANRQAHQRDHQGAGERFDVCRCLSRLSACQRGRRQDLGAEE